MIQRGRFALRGSAIPLAALVAGLLTGCGLLEGCAVWAGLSGLAGVALLLVGSCRSPWTYRTLPARVAVIALAAYAAALLFVEPVVHLFDSISNGWAAARSVTVLIPFLLGGVILADHGWRLAAVGCGFLFYGGVASLTYNVLHTGSGVWFVQAWIE
jgi:hypothetical protein